MRRLTRRTTALCLTALTSGALAASVVAAGPVGAAPLVRTTAKGTAKASAPVADPVVWGACTDPDLQAAGAECGFVRVPLDRLRPTGPSIRIALSRVRHTVPDAQYQGVMLANPGGPGGSGLFLATFGAFVPDGAGAAYDWIGFDPRGVGASEPALSCDGSYFAGPRPPYDPTTRAVERAWTARSKAYAADCAAAAGPLLRHLRSVDTIADMESIRVALGASQLNFYGFSYGTYLGQLYATLHPDRVRRMVLDSTIDARTVWNQANFDQDVAFERNLDRWFAWVARYDAVYHLGTKRSKVRARWIADRDRLAARPAGGLVGPAEWTDIFINAGYVEVLWPLLADVWANWHADRSDPAELVGVYEQVETPGDDNLYAIYLATECTDAPWPRDWSVQRADVAEVAEDAPLTAWWNGWFNAPCTYWKARASRPVEIDGRRAPAILLVGETLDAATPFEGSLEARSRFPRARLVGLPGGGSHAFSLSGNACLDGYIARYLADGTLPDRRSGRRADATCAPAPQPVPTQLVPAAAPSSAGTSRTTAGTAQPPLTAPERALRGLRGRVTVR